MSDEDDKPDKMLECSNLNIGEEILDKDYGKSTWVIIRELGKGAFGTVYQVQNKATKQDAAMKIELITGGDNVLKMEKEIMLAMEQEETAIHIYDDGVYNDFRFIVMTLCGPDLQKIADLMNGKFSQETIIRVCIRTLLAIKTIHEYEYVHRDLKPCNFAVDYNPNSLHIYLFDYGMSRRYARKDNNSNRWYLRRARNPARFRGTIRYCSLNMHKRMELGRVDDVWSWFFMMMEMQAPLPWTNTIHPDRVEVQKQDHLLDYLNKDPFYRSLLPIVTLLNATEYADRPDYLKIYEILYQKLKDMNGKLSGPMEYTTARINAIVTEFGESARPREQSRMEDELTIQKYLSNSFGKIGIPGGNHLVMDDNVDFFKALEAPTPPPPLTPPLLAPTPPPAPTPPAPHSAAPTPPRFQQSQWQLNTQKKTREEKPNDNKKGLNRDSRDQKNLRNKILKKTKQPPPPLTIEKIEGQRPVGSKMSQHKRAAKGFKK